MSFSFLENLKKKTYSIKLNLETSLKFPSVLTMRPNNMVWQIQIKKESNKIVRPIVFAGLNDLKRRNHDPVNLLNNKRTRNILPALHGNDSNSKDHFGI